MDIPWWGWLLIIAGAGLLLIVVVLVLPFLLIILVKQIRTWRYNWMAKRVNDKARKLRLQRTDWYGYPLPTGPEGELVITEKMMIHNRSVSQRQLEKAYLDRARDLGVDIWIERSEIDRDIHVRWRKPRRKVVTSG